MDEINNFSISNHPLDSNKISKSQQAGQNKPNLSARSDSLPYDSVSFSSKEEASNSSSNPGTLNSLLIFARKQGANFQNFINNMTDLAGKTTFSFVGKDHVLNQINPHDQEEAYHQALLATSEEALKTYDRNKDGTVTSNEMFECDKEALEKYIATDITQFEKSGKKDIGKFVEGQKKLAELTTDERQRQVLLDNAVAYEQNSLANLEQKKQEKINYWNENKPGTLETVRTFAQNLATFDDDPSSISDKDMATWIMAADAQDKICNGKQIPFNDFTKISDHIVKNGKNGLEPFISDVNDYYQKIKNSGN